MIQKYPDDVLGYLNMGKVYMRMKAYSNALDMYNKSLLLDKSKLDIYVNKGVCLFNLKQYKEAIPYIEKGKLDSWTHNKTIQKAIESYRITDEQKEYLRKLKIK